MSCHLQRAGVSFSSLSLIEALGNKSSNESWCCLWRGGVDGVKTTVRHALSALKGTGNILLLRSVVLHSWAMNELRRGRTNTDTNHRSFPDSDQMDRQQAEWAENLPNWKRGQNWAVTSLTFYASSKEGKQWLYYCNVSFFLSILAVYPPSSKASLELNWFFFWCQEAQRRLRKPACLCMKCVRKLQVHFCRWKRKRNCISGVSLTNVFCFIAGRCSYQFSACSSFGEPGQGSGSHQEWDRHQHGQSSKIASVRSLNTSMHTSVCGCVCDENRNDERQRFQ